VYHDLHGRIAAPHTLIHAAPNPARELFSKNG